MAGFKRRVVPGARPNLTLNSLLLIVLLYYMALHMLDTTTGVECFKRQ